MKKVSLKGVLKGKSQNRQCRQLCEIVLQLKTKIEELNHFQERMPKEEKEKFRVDKEQKNVWDILDDYFF